MILLNKKQKLVFLILGGFLVLNMAAWLLVLEASRQQFLEVNFFDIGQGDAIFIVTPQGHQILIDGGPGLAILEKLGREMPFGDRTIDLIILTHPDHDHMAGLLYVLEAYDVEQILWTGVECDKAEFEKWKTLIKEEEAKITIARAGQYISVSGAFFNIIHPQEILKGLSPKNLNNTSIVINLIFGNRSFLLTGDADQSTERELVQKKYLIKTDVLKIGHHGSKTSTSEELLNNIMPEIAVIQAGRNNSYGHPNEEVLEKLEKFGIKILRTDIDGDIKIITDGNNLNI